MKKLTKKEIKALNHAKLMGQKGKPAETTSNVINFQDFKDNKKAA